MYTQSQRERETHTNTETQIYLYTQHTDHQYLNAVKQKQTVETLTATIRNTDSATSEWLYSRCGILLYAFT